MKGHTTIELTNVKTGEVQTIEEDNIVTNYLPELLRPHYPFCATWKDSCDYGVLLHDAANLNPAINPYHDFGGLIMFRESLDADPDNYHPDVSLTMTAHASDDVYIGNDLTRGSFNKPLSGYKVNWASSDESSFVRLVWDFGLEQGNGTIGTVCVCNHNDGKIGFGSQYAVSANFDEMSFLFHHSPFSPISEFSAYIKEEIDPAITTKPLKETPYIEPVFYDSENGRLVCIDNSMIYGDCIRFVVIDTNSNSIQPINLHYAPSLTSSNMYPSDMDTYCKQYQYYRSYAYYYPLNVLNVFKSSTTDSFASYFGKSLNYYIMLGGVCPDGTYYYFADACHAQNNSSHYKSDVERRWTWNAGTARTLVKVDLRTMESTEISVTNTTGVNLVMLGRTTISSLISGILVHSNYLIFRNSDGCLYRINLSNNSDAKRATWLDDKTPLSVTAPANYVYTSSSSYASNWDYLPSIFQYVIGNYMFFATGRSLNYSANTTVQLRVLDLDTFEARYVSATARSGYPAYSCHTGVQTITGFTSNNGYPYCSSDCEIVPVRDKSSNSSTWNDTTKAIYHNLHFKQFFKPMGLITINTLAEPVTKTADMTMRITYTLTA